MNYIDLSTTPLNVPCEQVGTSNYDPVRAKLEAVVFRDQLYRMFPCSVSGRIGIVSNPHDFGNYYELRVYFDENSEEAVNWAYGIDENLPEEWDEEARKAMGITAD